MDRISGLSDDLLIKILLLLPTKVAVSTSILSKRWECIWMWLPKLKFGNRFSSMYERQRLQCFLDRNLPLHRAPVIESFRLKLFNSDCEPKDIKVWVLVAISRYLRELEISLSVQRYNSNILPSSLYNCKSLVTLNLEGGIRLDVPRMVSLPCLKNLQLQRLTHLNGESLRRLLSICPVLEDLLVHCYKYNDDMKSISINVPSLQSLSIYIPLDYCGLLCDGLVIINTPSLKYLKLEDLDEWGHKCLIENMPMLREAHIDVNFPDISSIIGSITSVKRLTFSSKAYVSDAKAQVYGGGFVFNQLEHLKICLRNDNASSLLVQLLEDSPNLRVLDVFKTYDKYDRMVCWNQPGIVPKCIMSSLQTFKWSRYLGRPLERDIVVYILTNACRLKTATISFDYSFVGSKIEMIKELSLSSRASTTCQLVFD